MSKINIDRALISKLCVKCHKNNLIDDVEFTINQQATRFAKGDVCIECFPHVFKEYEEYMKNTRKSRKVLDIYTNLTSKIDTRGASSTKTGKNIA